MLLRLWMIIIIASMLRPLGGRNLSVMWSRKRRGLPGQRVRTIRGFLVAIMRRLSVAASGLATLQFRSAAALNCMMMGIVQWHCYPGGAAYTCYYQSEICNFDLCSVVGKFSPRTTETAGGRADRSCYTDYITKSIDIKVTRSGDHCLFSQSWNTMPISTHVVRIVPARQPNPAFPNVTTEGMTVYPIGAPTPWYR